MVPWILIIFVTIVCWRTIRFMLYVLRGIDIASLILILIPNEVCIWYLVGRSFWPFATIFPSYVHLKFYFIMFNLLTIFIFLIIIYPIYFDYYVLPSSVLFFVHDIVSNCRYNKSSVTLYWSDLHSIFFNIGRTSCIRESLILEFFNIQEARFFEICKLCLYKRLYYNIF